MLRVLFVLSEMVPYSKTGGLADVGGALPLALQQLGDDIRVLVPWYGRPDLNEMHRICSVNVPYTHEAAEIWITTNRPQVYFLRYPAYYERGGGPYQNTLGQDWPDNPRRFALLNRVAVELAQGRVAGLDWRPDLVHVHDWQTGLIPYLLELETRVGNTRPATLFTIHNLAYQGRFDPAIMTELHMPGADFHWQGTELYGAFSFMKAGLVYSDRLSTVSPTYAQEIQTDAFGMGLQGLLQQRAGQLSGILNGVDEVHWNPRADPYLPAHYHARNLVGKSQCKAQLQQHLGLEAQADFFLLGMISRLVDQKGIDMVLEVLPDLLQRGMQVAILGSGEKHYETRLQELAAIHPGRLAVHIGFDEGLSHRIEAGADAFLMPSRFEPCGLNQMYSLRYGTLPIVHQTGGLADTVVDAGDIARDYERNGFVFSIAHSDDLHHAVLRAAALFQQPAAWQRLQQQAMAGNYSWEHSALAYQRLYQQILARP
ncbi:glycogen synthase GlgA [Acidithiobacillus montserratensis]|uniref:Glycogen synthase GlgA n=1 Tax=Acidithiobacillus montserratensis TaxID=2729135 RepID=A0ACD5HD89_9PROT|nr:glycogen synthase GlgA [Acidithiobacillus montserratensis]MBN2678791.1 glycogen synthase GlgA [Acidithiobacillaceae bacterium]MBU2749035.1 glycogen synthase GlgA [Acidithiobacillus montserratensis]